MKVYIFTLFNNNLGGGRKMNELQSQQTLVSIIVPVYNSEKYLKKCIESIIEQTYKNIELILVDDNSKDNSGNICAQYEMIEKRIKVIRNKTNKGPASARNRGIEKATGSFVIFVDSDDFIEKDLIELLTINQNKYGVNLVIGNYNKVINDDKFIKYNDEFFDKCNKSSSDYKILQKENLLDYARIYLKYPNKHLLFSYCWGKLYDLKIIKKNEIKFDENLQIFEDTVFNFSYFKYVNTALYIEKAVYNYSIRNDYSSVGMNILDQLSNNANMLQVVVSKFLELSNTMDDSEIKRETGHSVIFLIIAHLIRICGQINKSNRKRIYMLTHKIVYDSIFQENLESYYVYDGYSKIIPFLMKIKQVRLIMFVCKYKAYKRYGKGGLVNESYKKRISG